jgi:phospholipid transport system substrate-binding protein
MKKSATVNNLVLIPFFAATILVASAVWFVCYADSLGPLAQTEWTVNQILFTLNDEHVSAVDRVQQKRNRIMTLVDQRFDFREMSKMTLAQAWKEMSFEEQEHFVALFAALLKDTYVTKVESYSGEEVKFVKQIIKNDKAMVMSVIGKNGAVIPMIYKLMRIGDEWKVYDVVIEGVSLVRNYRSQFANVINSEKYSGLIARLENKVKGKEV